MTWIKYTVYLILVWIFHQHALFHAVGDNCVASKGCHMSSNHSKHLCNKGVEEATNTSFLQKFKTQYVMQCFYRWWWILSATNTSRRDVVSLIKNILMIPRYLMMRVPGRKDSGVIFTTVTEPPPKERVERSERERPSGRGLQRSREETKHFIKQEEGSSPMEQVVI